MDLIRSFMVTAIFTCFIAILFSAEWSYLMNCTRGFLPKVPLAAMCNIYTGILVLTAVVVFEVSIVESKPFKKSKPPSRNWAFFTSCVVCILSFLTGIYGLILFKLSLWRAPQPAPPVGPE